MSAIHLSAFGSSLSAGLVLMAIVGCSSSGTTSATDPNAPKLSQNNDDTEKTTDGGTSSVSAKFTCCLNDVFYVCPDKAATDQCAFGGFDFGACMAKCTDPACSKKCSDQLSNASPDPSKCKEQSGKKCPATKTTASCVGIGDGSCQYDHQCGSGRHCNGGRCFDDATGSKCEYDHQCGSGNHCTDGCCQGNDTGTTCEYDHQCGSGAHCTSGRCHDDAVGSPCQYDHQCGSGNSCESGTCG